MDRNIEEMTREELVKLADEIGYKFQSNMGDEKLRERLKAELERLNNPTPPSADSADTQKTIETWSAELNTPSWQFAAIKQANKWTAGKTLTKEQYQNGFDALNKPIGS